MQCQRFVLELTIVDQIVDASVITPSAALERSRALKRPSNDIHPRLLSRNRILARHDLPLRVHLRQCKERRRHNLNTALRKLGDGRCRIGISLGCVDAFVEVHGLLAELGLVLDPVEDIGGEEALSVDAVGIDLLLLERVDEVLGVLLLFRDVWSLRHGGIRGANRVG